ncbi:MAG TPA: type VI secretion system baseplate subunit TssF [Verrucomicrobiae bacterium]|jgi:type VI secretion system protein ImpG
MDDRFVKYFEEELTHVRRMTDEFKAIYPRVAERLQLGQTPADPYVQQLMDAFAFLAARVQLKLDGEYPRFIEALLQTIFPHYLAPIPAMAIVQFEPQHDSSELADGPVVERHTRLTSKWLPGPTQDSVRCTYRTAHDLQILPIRLTDARYYSQDRDLSEVDNSWARESNAKAAIRLRLETTGGLPFNRISADKLVIHLPPRENLTGILYELILAHSKAVVVQSAARPVTVYSRKYPAPVRGMGFEENEALLPTSAQGFSGYRILQEYFAFPNRFFFIEVSGLSEAFAKCAKTELDLLFCLNEEDPRLENRRLQTDCFMLHCVPAINLFEKENIIVELKEEKEEHPVVPDWTKTLEYEVYSVKRVVGQPRGAAKPDEKFEFHPFYFSSVTGSNPAGFFSTRRLARNLTDQESRQNNPVSDYLGSDVYLSFSGEALQASLKQLASLNVTALCTNRHLPQRHLSGLQFDPVVAPVQSIRTLATIPPRPPHVAGRLVWRVVSHLALNYRSLLSSEGKEGAAALQELLRLYLPSDREADVSQIRALKKAVAKPDFQRIENKGPLAYARGLSIHLEVEETPFNDTGVFLLGAVLDRFFSRYVTINSFVQTELWTAPGPTGQGRKVFKWPIAKGTRQIL